VSDAGSKLVVSPREGYDLWSSIYDDEDNPLIRLEAAEVMRALGEVRGMEAADLGCGTGRHALAMAAAGARVTALDFSEGMLAKARAKPGAEAVRFIRHDLSKPLPLDSDQFDRVTCCLVLEHVSKLAPVFVEMRRIARPGARIVVSEMHPAMTLRGVTAHFRDPETGRDVRPESAGNQISDFVMAAVRAGFGIENLLERAVDEELAAASPRAAKHLGWPLLFLMTLRAP
jgi:malonyl-CoA O-methyltransferase